ncbi:MAG TPA: GNAT family protein [Iamia sp.]|nr:GNAT family protein [Iamia sp.]
MIEIPEAGPLWADEVLAARDEMSLTPDLGEVRTERLVIRPYSRDDAEELFAVSNGEPVTRMGRSIDAYDADALVWRFMQLGPFADADGLHALHAPYLERPDTQPSTVVDATTGELVGSVTLLANVPADLRVEIGNVWYTPAVQGMGVNREVTMALAEALFALGYQRYEWKCNALNLRSRHAAEAMGFTYEGTFRAHMIVKGRRRDTAWFSLVPADDVGR